LKRCKEKILLYQNEIPKIESKLEELGEVIGVLSQLDRYKKPSPDSVPQNGGTEHGN